MKRLVGGGILLALLLGLLYLPVELPFDTVSIGKVLPAQEWKLMQDQTGHLSAIIRNYETGVVDQMGSFQFESGDVSGLEVAVSRSDSGSYMSVGDTVVRLYSAMQKQELQEVLAQIELYQAQLLAENTGEKNPIVQEAEHKLFFARQDLTLKEKNFNIRNALYRDSVIAKTEFLQSENEYELAKIQVDIAQKNLETAQTGLKNESLDVTRNRIDNLQKRAALLRQKGLKFLIRAPFSGYVSPILLPGELLTLQRADMYMVQIPVKVQYLSYINPQTAIEVQDVRTGRSYSAHIVQIAPQIEVYDSWRIATVIATIKCDQPGPHPGTGIAATCTIRFGNVNPREYLSRLLNFSLQKR